MDANISKLDDRYFIGLEGQYIFTLHFRLEKEGESDYIVRSHGNYSMKRSVNVDVELEAGTYFVRMNISAKRDPSGATVEEVIRDHCRVKQDKLIQIGQAYDLAHAKGQNRESEAEKKVREAREEKHRAAQKKLLHVKLREQKLRHWQLEMKQRARERRHAKRKEDRQRKRAEAAAPNGNVEKDGLPATGDVPVGTDPSSAVTNGVAAAEAGSDLVKTTEDETTQTNQDAGHLPSPPAELSSPAPSVPSGDTLKSTEAPVEVSAEVETKTQDSIPITPSEATRSTELISIGEAPPEEATTKAEPQKFESAAQTVPSVLVNGTSLDIEPAPPSTTGGPLPDDSDYASDASFDSSVDSELDFLEGQAIDVVPQTIVESDDEDAEFANDPWNAVCVVGLRVYSKDQEMTVQVVRPTEESGDDEPARDVDDISKGASKEPIGDAVQAKAGQEE